MTIQRPPLLAISLLSAAALGYEVLLMRLFSIIQWHHFAYMAISVAMLGYGTAGTFVALSQRTLQAHFGPVFVGAAASFGFTAVAGFLLAQQVAFNPLEILWDARQPLRLLAVFGLLFVPFFCAAIAICLTFTRFAGQPHRIYSFDILGAGAGCLGIVAVLFATTPSGALQAIGALGFVAAAVAAYTGAACARALPAVLLGAAVITAIGLPGDWTRLRPSPYKELSQALAIGGTRIVAERSSPMGLVTVAESPQVPFRLAPGLSLNATMEPPPQLGVFIDGDGPGALVHDDGRRESLAYLDSLTSALPYHLLDRPRVLVLGAGAGVDVLQAKYHRARAIDAVEIDPQVVDLVQNEFGAFSGRPYSAPGVRVHVAEARGFVAGRGGRYDLIQVALLDAFGATSAGLHSLSENYLYTVEALQEYVDHLDPGGMLAITRWVQLPPRDVLKLFATAVESLERRGNAQAGRSLALIRGWRTATLLVKNGAFTDAEITALRAFCRARSFDVEYHPGIANAAAAERFNILEQPWFREGTLALLGEGRAAFVERYKFNIVPATDDKPYFFHFFKWRTSPELLAQWGRGGLPLLEWGYPVLVATLVQAVAASLLMILLPLWIVRRRGDPRAGPPESHVREAFYFLAIGFAFMFVEMAFIQKFLLFLSHPLHAVAVVLSAFLAFAGLGSSYSGRVQPPAAGSRDLRIAWPVAAIIVVGSLYLAILPGLFRYLMGLHDAGKILVSMGLIAPLAFAMGMPFPLALAGLARRCPAFIPWAWGINAFASVVGAILASLLAIHVGFGAVVLLALLLYGLAWWSSAIIAR
ncbi:MAG TPA: SAM-dependent methyltransferase [Usitatibacteraceae bacterium]|nr:SAM-dependent methyltransferase [Usitatibacteraceae bacterium]